MSDPDSQVSIMLLGEAVTVIQKDGQSVRVAEASSVFLPEGVVRSVICSSIRMAWTDYAQEFVEKAIENRIEQAMSDGEFLPERAARMEWLHQVMRKYEPTRWWRWWR